MKVSMICAVMNRNALIEPALENWLAAEGVEEVVLVDWSSNVPVRDGLSRKLLEDPKLRIYRVVGESRWILSHAFNLAASLAKSYWIAKVDIDYRIDSGFFGQFDLPADAFIRGDWEFAMTQEDKFLNGFLLVRKQVYFLINGYNENLIAYGYDDSDFYSRLTSAGLTPISLVPKWIHHVPHDDTLRLANQTTEDRVSSIRKNAVLAQQLKTWLPSRWQINPDFTVLRNNII